MNMFFQMVEDEAVAKRSLGHPYGVNGRVPAENFVLGKPCADARELTISCLAPGPDVDINFAVYYMLVLRKHIGEIIRASAPGSCVGINAAIEGSSEKFEILNIINRVDCIDLARSKLEALPPEEWDVEPVCQFKAVYELRIDSNRARGYDIFRPSGWPWAVIVSDRLKELVDRTGSTGVKFEKVS